LKGENYRGERGRWLAFFLWLGVNQSLRPVHFHDVEDRASGWLKTANLQQPEGWIFKNVDSGFWNGYIVPDRKPPPPRKDKGFRRIFGNEVFPERALLAVFPQNVEPMPGFEKNLRVRITLHSG